MWFGGSQEEEKRVVGKKTRGIGRGEGRGRTLNSLVGLIKIFLLRKRSVFEGCMPERYIIRFAVLIVK